MVSGGMRGMWNRGVAEEGGLYRLCHAIDGAVGGIRSSCLSSRNSSTQVIASTCGRAKTCSADRPRHLGLVADDPTCPEVLSFWWLETARPEGFSLQAFRGFRTFFQAPVPQIAPRTLPISYVREDD